MEEIITVDGKQFKLMTDQPLTTEQKSHTIAEIRKQTGCSTCTPKIARIGNDWQYGGIHALPGTTGTCTKETASSTIGDVVTLNATPDDGTAPYTVRFLRQIGGLDGTTPSLLVIGTSVGTTQYGLQTDNAEQTGLLDGQETEDVVYQLADAEIVAAGTGAIVIADGPGEGNGGVDGSGFGLPPLAVNTVRFITHVKDSCPTKASPLAPSPGRHCLQYCDLAVVCVVPTCNFVVT